MEFVSLVVSALATQDGKVRIYTYICTKVCFVIQCLFKSGSHGKACKKFLFLSSWVIYSSLWNNIWTCIYTHTDTHTHTYTHTSTWALQGTTVRRQNAPKTATATEFAIQSPANVPAILAGAAARVPISCALVYLFVPVRMHLYSRQSKQICFWITHSF